MAALIAQEMGVTPELVEGNRGEFTIWVGDNKVASKSLKGFPSDDTVMTAVRNAVGK